MRRIILFCCVCVVFLGWSSAQAGWCELLTLNWVKKPAERRRLERQLSKLEYLKLQIDSQWRVYKGDLEHSNNGVGDDFLSQIDGLLKRAGVEGTFEMPHYGLKYMENMKRRAKILRELSKKVEGDLSTVRQSLREYKSGA